THQTIDSAAPIETKAEPATTTAIIDTTTNKPDTTVKVDTPVNITAPVANSSNGSFNIVLRNYNNADAADKALKKFKTYGHKMVVIKIDSINYQLAMPFSTPLSDTTRARDSLKRFFGGRPFVRL
ncbi:MAG: SPOR domain-containing protein, partial [Ferruginibacter sp.]